MKARTRIVVSVLAASMALAMPTSAITFGKFDGNRHPHVGAMVAEWRKEGQRDLFCSGTLIDDDVFLTAAHCTEALRAMGIGPNEVWVTFDPTYDQDTSRMIRGTYTSHPGYNHRQSDPKDLAVVELRRSVETQPARLPVADKLTNMRNNGNLQDAWFTAVGYGLLRKSKTGGPNNLQDTSKRHYATQTFNTLTNAWLKLDMHDGGTCYGDSGGPHFLRDTRLLVSVTVTGDAACRATDVTYRLDTPSARNFLDDFVDLP